MLKPLQLSAPLPGQRKVNRIQQTDRSEGAWENVDRPLIMAVVQGGGFKDLRKRCADALLEIALTVMALADGLSTNTINC